MVEARTLRLAIPRPIRELPADLAAVLALVAATNVAVLAPLVRDTPLRISLGLAFVLFLPGYAFVAALFPETGESPTGGDGPGEAEPSGDTGGADAGADDAGLVTGVDRSGIDGIERVALSFGLSIAIVPLLGLVLTLTPWGIRLVPIVLTVTAVTVVATVVAAVRRWNLPAEERFRVPYREWYEASYSELFEPETRTDAVLNVMLAASIVLAAGVMGYAILVPPTGEQFSAVYLLTGDDGELVADDYPTELEPGETADLVVGVDNHEHERTQYTVVLLEQRVEFVDGTTGAPVNRSARNNASTVENVVAAQRELDRFRTTLAHNESWHHRHTVAPTYTDEDVRLVWLLFPGGDVPAEPSVDDTEYSAHLWVDVGTADGG